MTARIRCLNFSRTVVTHWGVLLGKRLTLIWESSFTPMAILRKVKAVMSTLLDISSIQEIPEAKKYLMMTFVEIMTRRNVKKRDARMALIKWIALKKSLVFIRPNIPPLKPCNRVNHSNLYGPIQEVQ